LTNRSKEETTAFGIVEAFPEAGRLDPTVQWARMHVQAELQQGGIELLLAVNVEQVAQRFKSPKGNTYRQNDSRQARQRMTLGHSSNQWQVFEDTEKQKV